MLEVIQDKIAFKNRNLASWYKNTEFWLNSELRQLTDTREFLLHKLPTLFDKPGMSVLDMGAGNGWALDLLNELNINCTYTAIDFNPLFIEHLEQKFNKQPDAFFYTVDFEEDIPDNLLNSADIVFNFFNFFEVANIEKAFENANKILKPNGKLIILTIDSYYLMMALSKDMGELKSVLKIYEEKKSNGQVPFFFQKIDLGNGESDEYEYASVLYSFEDYFKEAIKHKMMLLDYTEIVKTSKVIPKVYKYIVFGK